MPNIKNSRINRIGKRVYNEIFIINFFPTEKGADIVRSREIAQTKMFMIHNVLGEDARIFDPDEEPQPAELYRRLTTYMEEEEESFFTKVRRDFERIKELVPEIEKEIKDIPNRVKVAKKGSEDELLVFVKKGKDLFVGYKNYHDKQPEAVSFEEVYEKISVAPDEEKLSLSDRFWANYHQVLDRSTYFSHHSTRGQNFGSKAFNLLNTLLKDDDRRLTPYKKFLSDLLEDIKFYGTLSEYVLSEIVDWEAVINDKEKLIQSIEALKGELGEDFLLKIERHLKEMKEEVIIAVENIKSPGT